MNFKGLIRELSDSLGFEDPNPSVNRIFRKLLDVSEKERKYFKGAGVEVFVESVDKYFSRNTGYSETDSHRFLIEKLKKYYTLKRRLEDDLNVFDPHFSFVPFLNEENRAVFDLNLNLKIEYLLKEIKGKGYSILQFDIPDMYGRYIKFSYESSSNDAHLIEINENAFMKHLLFNNFKIYGNSEFQEVEENPLYVSLNKGVSFVLRGNKHIIQSYKRFEEDFISDISIEFLEYSAKEIRNNPEYINDAYDGVVFFPHREYDKNLYLIQRLYDEYKSKIKHGTTYSFLNSVLKNYLSLIEKLSKWDNKFEYYGEYGHYRYFHLSTSDIFAKYDSSIPAGLKDLIAIPKDKSLKYSEDIHFFHTMLSELYREIKKYSSENLTPLVQFSFGQDVVSNHIKSDLIWNGTQTEFMELIKALIESGSIKDSNKKGKQIELVRALSDTLNTNIKNPDKLISDIKNRNNDSETLFLDKLKDHLIAYITKENRRK